MWSKCPFLLKFHQQIWHNRYIASSKQQGTQKIEGVKLLASNWDSSHKCRLKLSRKRSYDWLWLAMGGCARCPGLGYILYSNKEFCFMGYKWHLDCCSASFMEEAKKKFWQYCSRRCFQLSQTIKLVMFLILIFVENMIFFYFKFSCIKSFISDL